jgi:hypothetical protein
MSPTCRKEYFTYTHIMQGSGILTHALGRVGMTFLVHAGAGFCSAADAGVVRLQSPGLPGLSSSIFARWTLGTPPIPGHRAQC